MKQDAQRQEEADSIESQRRQAIFRVATPGVRSQTSFTSTTRPPRTPLILRPETPLMTEKKSHPISRPQTPLSRRLQHFEHE